MGFCSNLLKALLVTFNIVCLLCGLAVLIVGAVILSGSTDLDSVISEIDSGLQAPPITLIVIGSIIFIVSFMGCCGALKDNKCLLITYAVLLILIFIVQLVIGIYAVANISQDSVTDTLSKIFDRMNDHPEDADIFHDMEATLDCCGVHGPFEYITSNIPSSCFSDNHVIPNTQGCGEALYNWLEDAGKIIGGVAIGLSIIEIVCATLAIAQSRKGKNMF